MVVSFQGHHDTVLPQAITAVAVVVAAVAQLLVVAWAVVVAVAEVEGPRAGQAQHRCLLVPEPDQ